MKRVRIKICGITRPQDAVLAANLGADAIGLIFYPKSPRAVTIAQAREIISIVPPFLKIVGVFVNEKKDKIEQILSELSLDLLQFHGDETVQACEHYEKPYIKAIHVLSGQEEQAIKIVSNYSSASGFIVDAYDVNQYGGTGKTFNWQRFRWKSDKPLILSGGLNPDNIQTAIELVKPYAVDVVSGVEAAKGIKDPEKLKRFVEQVMLLNHQAHYFKHKFKN